MAVLAPGEMLEIPLLDQADCARAKERVEACREAWIRRDPHAPFFMLGAAAYADVQYAPNPMKYHYLIRHLNPLLKENFGWLYQRLEDVLRGVLDGPIVWPRRVALPGFHIMLADRAFEQPVCAVHVDIQYKHLPWPETDRIDFDHPLSFTLPIALPSSKAGLMIWPKIRFEDFVHADSETAERLLRENESALHEYRVGQLVLHNGHSVHQIAPNKINGPEDVRVTMQGHALRSAHGWMIYW